MKSRCLIAAHLRWATCFFLVSAGTRVRAGEVRGVVVDQTALALPGVRLYLLDGEVTVRSTTTSNDGRFVFDLPRPGLRIRAALEGFATVTVNDTDAGQIVMSLAGTTDTAEVTASVSADDSPTAAASGTQLVQATAGRLAAGKHAREALPLLPSVIRGPDGLLHIDGVRPHESPLLLDGFDVTDPATGLASIDVPIEAAASVGILRDPMNITVGGALGSLASIETRSGGAALEAGIEGFVPRPRLTGGGFGTLEGFSPRAFVGGSSGRSRYFGAAEFDFNRIPVPGVTSSTGSPDTRQVGGTLFGRYDFQVSGRDTLSIEGLFLAGHREFYGLSPLRTVAATLTRFDRDVFGGVVDRHTFGKSTLLTLRLGLLGHRAESGPGSTGDALITPYGWDGGSFSSLQRDATRAQASVSLQTSVATAHGPHDLTVQAGLESRSLQGTVAERATMVTDTSGAVVRSLSFGPPTTIAATDQGGSIAVRDLWQPNSALQIDGGVRADFSSLGGWAPSARLGVRYALSEDGASVLKGGVGTFVGSVPLAAPAFAGFPIRFDKASSLGTSSFSPAGVVLQPVVSGLALPRAFAANLRLERALSPNWDATLGVGFRQASQLATLDVRPDLGLLRVTSDGRSDYREAEVGLRHTWGKTGVFFVSYTLSSAKGELNDFSSLFANGDIEVLQSGGMSRLTTDTPHRLLAWSVIDLPKGFGISPALEWRSGFPYSTLDSAWRYAGVPNDASFPPSFSLNLVVDKKLVVKRRPVKLNVQMFNVTNHFNPTQVYSVLGSSRYGTFTNSVGLTVRGDITLGW